jgi:hypothetical protein
MAPDTARDASGAACNRLGVNGSLSAISSDAASSAILFNALAETILAKGEFEGRIHPRPSAKAMMAYAVIGRNPATVPMPIVNSEMCWCRIFSWLGLDRTLRTAVSKETIDPKSARYWSFAIDTACETSRRAQTLDFDLSSQLLTNAHWTWLPLDDLALRGRSHPLQKWTGNFVAWWLWTKMPFRLPGSKSCTSA